MKRIVVTALAIATCAAAWGYLGQVVGSFRSPAGTQTRGLARSNTYLFIADAGNRGLVYRVIPNTGSVRNFYQLAWYGVNSGLAYSTSATLWVGCPANDFVYRCHAPTGSVYGSWDARHDAHGCAPLCTGDGGTGTTYLFTSDTSPPDIFTHRLTNGSVVRSVRVPYPTDYDCAYDWRNKVVWLGDSPNVVYGYNLSGSVLGSFRSPAYYPRGLAYYGQYLFIACNGNGYIYRVHCPYNFVAVAPASLGEVKALLR
jgi:hypothetical protein